MKRKFRNYNLSRSKKKYEKKKQNKKKQNKNYPATAYRNSDLMHVQHKHI